MPKTHWKKFTDTNYLGAYSLEDGKDIVLTIKAVRQEPVIGADGKKENCIVCHFAEDIKPMILNATNCKMISKLYKTSYIEDWAGKKVQIGIERVSAFGDVVEALRIRKTIPASAVIKCKCGKTLVAANGMSPEQLAAYTTKQYGEVLCVDCAKERKNAKT